MCGVIGWQTPLVASGTDKGRRNREIPLSELFSPCNFQSLHKLHFVEIHPCGLAKLHTAPVPERPHKTSVSCRRHQDESLLRTALLHPCSHALL